MMEWLKSHAFLATWLSPVIAVAIAVLRNKQTGGSIDVRRMVVYIAFLTALAVVFTPGFEPDAKLTARTIALLGFGFLVGDAFRN
jgi:hypothetical protein